MKLYQGRPKTAEGREEKEMKVYDLLDSLDIVDMVVLVEKHFGVRMAKEDFSRIRTFADLYDMIAGRTAL